MQVGQLVANLGLSLDRSSFARGERALTGLQRMAGGVAAAFGLGGLAKAMLGFNFSVETAKNQIASMLAFAKKSDLTSELENANRLYDGLRSKAAELPGKTAEYVAMLAQLTQPLAGAGASLQTMENVTVRSFVLSKALNENWQKSARDLRELINFGRLSAVDTFSRTLLTGTGIDANDEGRAKLKAMSKEQRLALVEGQLNSKQISQMIDRLANSTAGRLERLQDTAQQTLGRVGKKLFEALGPTLQSLNNWLEANKERINAWADSVGQKIADAFAWLVENRETVVDVLQSVAAAFGLIALRAALAYWPIGLFVGAVHIFRKLKDEIGGLSAAFGVLSLAIGAAFAVGRIKAFIGALGGVAGAAGGAGAAAGGLAGGALGKLALLSAPVMAASLIDSGIDIVQGKEATERGNFAIKQLWSTMDIGQAMGAVEKRDAQTINDNRQVTINVNGAGDPKAVGAEVVKQSDLAAQQRAAYRNLTGNRGDE
jgi:hypothetical protein